MENEGGEAVAKKQKLQFLLTRALFRKPNDWELRSRACMRISSSYCKLALLSITIHDELQSPIRSGT